MSVTTPAMREANGTRFASLNLGKARSVRLTIVFLVPVLSQTGR